MLLGDGLCILAPFVPNKSEGTYINKDLIKTQVEKSLLVGQTLEKEENKEQTIQTIMEEMSGTASVEYDALSLLCSFKCWLRPTVHQQPTNSPRTGTTSPRSRRDRGG